jgi:hypothetical protein
MDGLKLAGSILGAVGSWTGGSGQSGGGGSDFGSDANPPTLQVNPGDQLAGPMDWLGWAQRVTEAGKEHNETVAPLQARIDKAQQDQEVAKAAIVQLMVKYAGDLRSSEQFRGLKYDPKQLADQLQEQLDYPNGHPNLAERIADTLSDRDARDQRPSDEQARQQLLNNWVKELSLRESGTDKGAAAAQLKALQQATTDFKFYQAAKENKVRENISGQVKKFVDDKTSYSPRSR